ncbi:hypothetical protein QJS10_CPB14g00068 [Acorus calamus]|uniref:Uncharacterized protein n=1 Tax=Acorus calamus TaxID=4465 RepID=A0AAV9DDJ2_ACOCL|nr:hypothetical protein QJS10_CPB14g00068 [Acorus calamus]
MLPQQPLLLNIEASSALPPSFTQLLDDSSIENRSAAETTRTTGANEVFHSSQVQQGIPVSSFQEITPQSKAVPMDDDMLLRIESVIDDLGGDLML